MKPNLRSMVIEEFKRSSKLSLREIVEELRDRHNVSGKRRKEIRAVVEMLFEDGILGQESEEVNFNESFLFDEIMYEENKRDGYDHMRMLRYEGLPLKEIRKMEELYDIDCSDIFEIPIEIDTDSQKSEGK
jgi:hypothetical protein